MNNIVDLSFPVIGEQLPSDHNYCLYSAISKSSPELHDLKQLAINTISGLPDQQGKITLTNSSRLYIRCSVEDLSKVYPLSGKTLRIGDHFIELGNPKLQPLKPATILKARLVTIKGYTEALPFLSAVQRQLDSMGIKGHIVESGGFKRLTMRINKIRERSYTIVGFTVVIADLSHDDSIKLQTEGLGGKRRLGCGVFHPWS